MVFPLAKMSTGIRVVTWAAMAVPASLVYSVWGATPSVRGGQAVVAALVVLVYASVGLLFRPRRFEVDRDVLRIVWPLRARTIPRAAVREARLVDGAAFRREHGNGARIGAGGLWGAFGLLWTRRGTYSMWISRTDRFVVVRLDGARPLLLTPERPEEMVGELLRLTG